MVGEVPHAWDHVFSLLSRIIRIKYKTVAPEGEQGSCPYRALLRAIRSKSKPVSFFHHHVKHLFIQDNSGADEEALLDALSACQGIQSLVLHFRKIPPSISPSLAAVRPQKLTVHLKSLSDCIDLCRPMFTLVTHLTVSDGSNFDSAVKGWAPFLAQLPSLTHLAFHHNTQKVLEELLASCKKLEVMVFLHHIPDAQPIYVSLKRVEDPRFVFMPLPAADRVDDWVRGTRGGTDFWAQADAFIAKKWRGEIEPSGFSPRFCHLIIVLNVGCFLGARFWIEAHDGIGPGYVTK